MDQMQKNQEANEVAENITQESENDNRGKKRDHSEKMEIKRILIYLGVTFLMTYIYEATAVRGASFSMDSNAAVLKTILVSAVMFFPTIGVIITKLITHEGFIKSSMVLPMRLKGRIWYYVLVWLTVVIVIFLGMGFYFLIFPDQFSAKMQYMYTLTESQGGAIPQISPAVIIILAMVTAPIGNILTCFGEEWGWRGYLLPKTIKLKLPVPVILLINGIIWGLWHAPLTVMGHNYGLEYVGYPIVGILAMCLFCTSLGVIFSYFTLKSGSCIAGAIGHGTVNGLAGLALYFTFDGGNVLMGPAITGVIAGIPVLLCAVLLTVLMMRDRKNGKLTQEIPY